LRAAFIDYSNSDPGKLQLFKESTSTKKWKLEIMNEILTLAGENNIAKITACRYLRILLSRRCNREPSLGTKDKKLNQTI
jgi:hypothetical protein